ncbi:MAG TPA: RNA methyltransferase, partial [Saprospiraceae bacterium]|nr:RNA methyltransferase [Saprospiraceae bacterium]
MKQLPPDFQNRISLQLGKEFEDFRSALQAPLPVSIRYNPKKIHAGRTGEPIPWCEYGRYLPERPVFTLDPLLHAGVYYVQEASSMLIEQAFKQISRNTVGALRVLDLCAAPGGKSTHLLSMISNDSLLVSNEVIQSRVTILSENLIKWGHPNCIVTCLDPKV